jgi:hypothetical protein
MRSGIPMGTSTFSLTPLLTTDALTRRYDQQTKKVVRPGGRTYMKRNTIGWQIFCQWKDGSTSWENLSALKKSHPLETAEYAVTIGIDHEPAFNWWVP